MLESTIQAPHAEPGITPDFQAFRRQAYRLTGLDLTSYKAPQMQRRLLALLARVQVQTFAEYARLLERDAARRQEFRDYVTINVSEFFRDAERFADLERRVLSPFRQHDLLRDAYPSGPFDLIACRNVVIYFTDAAKERIYAEFVRALRPGGVLFVGGTEAILRPQGLDLQMLGPGFYRKAAAP